MGDLMGLKSKEEGKQKLQEAMDSVPESVINEMMQLVKQNSIEGCKASECDIVYTPFLNLKKEERMDTGQVGFKDERFRKVIKGVSKDKDMIKIIEKTRKEVNIDLAKEKDQRDEEERQRKRKANAAQK